MNEGLTPTYRYIRPARVMPKSSAAVVAIVLA